MPLKILIGVSGSIAAYKSASLCRLLVKAGHEVKVILTDDGAAFITPLTLSTVSKNPVYTRFYEKDGTWVNHVELAAWADLLLIAPATANTLAKMAKGQCDNLLLAVYLSTTCPVYFAPAMDRDMYLHPATQSNLGLLKERSQHFMIPPEEGELASGISGIGRMAEPETIISLLPQTQNEQLAGIRFLVTAGPTYEAIDPVRYIGNHSSGKMGFALAEALAQKGAAVELITGPVQLSTNNPGIMLHRVISAAEMDEVCNRLFPNCDGAVMAAAVADFTPEAPAKRKIKKDKNENNSLVLKLVKTRDILLELGRLKQQNQVLAGFSLETNNEEEFALKKLKNKNLDLIVLNSLKDEGTGFGYDTNKIAIFTAKGEHFKFDLQSKRKAAQDIVQVIIKILEEKRGKAK
ncbi:MAG: bifunctional phosphopantothenoylcysteine decarboxylase/phosphopantothenate--cysteine ligase CoaBC [Bacteroidia bacterium]